MPSCSISPASPFAVPTSCIPCFLAAPSLLSFPASLLGYPASAPAFLSHTPHPGAVPQTPFFPAPFFPAPFPASRRRSPGPVLPGPVPRTPAPHPPAPFFQTPFFQAPFSRGRHQTRLPLHPPLPRRQPGNPQHPDAVPPIPFPRPRSPIPQTPFLQTPPAPARVIQANRLFFDMPPLPAPHSPGNRAAREPRLQLQAPCRPARIRPATPCRHEPRLQ